MTRFCFTEYELQRRMQRGIERYNSANDSGMLYWNGYSEAMRELLDLGRCRTAITEAAEEED